MTKGRIRIALVGCGEWASRTHVPNILEHPETELVAVCARRAESRKRVTDKTPATEFSTLEALIEAKAAEAVVIATPDGTHAPLSIQALEAGLHVFCENPIALTLDEALQVEEAAERSRSVFQVHLELRCSAAAQALKQIVSEGTIGEPYHAGAEVHRDWAKVDSPYNVPWRLDPSLSGGAILETWIHYLDLLSFVLNETPDRVFAGMSNPSAGDGTVITRYESGCLAAADFCLSAAGCEDHLSVDVVGRSGRAVASLDQGRVDVWKKDGENRIHTCIQAKGRPVVEFAGVRENFEDFVRAIRTGTEPLAGVEAGLTAVKHGLAVLQSLKTKAEERV